MALKRTSGSGKEKSDSSYVNIPEGEYEGRLVYVADLGLQPRSFSGEEKPPAYQIALGIELVGQTVEFNGETVPKLMWTKGFNIFSTMNEKGAELKYYKVFDPKATEETFADWEKQLGEPCSVQIGHRQGKGEHAGNVFDEITGVSSVPYKYKSSVPPALLVPCIGECEDENNPATKAMYGLVKWIHGRRIHE